MYVICRLGGPYGEKHFKTEVTVFHHTDRPLAGMAAITARSAKKSVSYHELYNLSTADLLFDEKKKKRRSESKSLGFFEAER